MGMHEDMERQRAVLNAQARQRAQREQAIREAEERGKAFLADFVRVAEARGIPKSWKHMNGSYYQKSEKWWQGQTLVKTYVHGWVVYRHWAGEWLYAIGEDSALYEPRLYGEAAIVDGKQYEGVPWQELTQVLLSGAPAVQEYNH